MIIDPRPDWQNDAACRGMPTDRFYPEPGGTQNQLIAVCNSCPVQADCLDHALANGERYGIWGGYGERSRRRIARARRRGQEGNKTPGRRQPDTMLRAIADRADSVHTVDAVTEEPTAEQERGAA